MQLTTEQSEQIYTSTFLVTGGAGFIGSHIAEFLLNAGARKVTVLDNLDTGHFRNLAPFANHPHFEFLQGDICDPDTCRAACKGKDYVFHEAALGSVGGSTADPITIKSVNACGFLNMLSAARDAAIKRFVYASGSPDNEENSECELLSDRYAKLYALETIGLRYYNVFGMRQDPRSKYAAIIPQLVMQLVRHESPVINGTGEYTFDLTYVENVVEANMLSIFTTDSEAINQVYDIVFKEKTRLNQLARYLREFLSAFDKSIAGIKIIQRPVSADKERPAALMSKPKKLLGYQPHFSLRAGLIKSAGWYWAYLPQFVEKQPVNREKGHALPAHQSKKSPRH